MPLAFAVAVVSALAFKPSTTTLYRAATGEDLCVPEMDCNIPNAENCEVQVYQFESSQNGPCLSPVSYGKID